MKKRIQLELTYWTQKWVQKVASRNKIIQKFI